MAKARRPRREKRREKNIFIIIKITLRMDERVCVNTTNEINFDHHATTLHYYALSTYTFILR